MSVRYQFNAFGADEVLVMAAQLAGKAGASAFEISYDRADGAPLRDDEEPDPDEALAWRAVATWRNGEVRTGTAISRAGDHQNAAALACANLLRLLGANVTVTVLDGPGG